MYYDTSTGALTSGAIIIWSYEVVNGDQIPCSSLSNYNAVIAHEIGHSLGLGDIYYMNPYTHQYVGTCSGAIMSEDPETIYSDECQTANDNFFTPTEAAGAPPPGDSSGGDLECPDASYIYCTSPIVINLDHAPYRLTGLSEVLIRSGGPLAVSRKGSWLWIGTGMV
jgi:hypothetical protein